MMRWRHITTAPRDGSEVLISGYMYNDTTAGRFVEQAMYISGGWYRDGDDSVKIHPHTHWMPLPDPPKDEEV